MMQLIDQRKRDNMTEPAGTCSIVRSLLVSSMIVLLLSSCSNIVYEPAPVVPTKFPFPYSAKIKLTHIGSYIVEPGATMIADPRIENHVISVSDSLDNAKKEWEKSVAEYLVARKTFTYLSLDSQTDIDIALRLNIYIDPGTLFQYRHVYVARVDAVVTDPRTPAVLSSQQGLGKAFGEVSRGGTEDDRGPINAAVQSALNDLFGKIENDSRLRRL